VREWLADEPTFGSAVVYQPPYSPDLNPIEHVWARIKKILFKKNISHARLTQPGSARGVGSSGPRQGIPAVARSVDASQARRCDAGRGRPDKVLIKRNKIPGS